MQDRQLQETHGLWHEIHKMAHYLNETRTRLTALEQKMNTNNAQEIKKLKDEMMQEIREVATAAGYEKLHGFWHKKPDSDAMVGDKLEHQKDKMRDFEEKTRNIALLRSPPRSPLQKNQAYV